MAHTFGTTNAPQVGVVVWLCGGRDWCPRDVPYLRVSYHWANRLIGKQVLQIPLEFGHTLIRKVQICMLTEP
jgi:hypothetical protein